MRKPTEHGILSDYRHVLAYAAQRFPSSDLVVYGHSLGGAVAVCLMSQLCADDFPNVKGLILENPFASIPDMVEALYPQRWLLYHHLGAFAFDRWDALSAIHHARPKSLMRRLSSTLMLFLSKNDQLVPNVMGESIFDASGEFCDPQGFVEENPLRRKVVLRRSLHENAWMERAWSSEMRRYVQSVGHVLSK